MSDKVFGDALDAFGERFNRELTVRWERCEETTIHALLAAAPEDKQGVLLDCFRRAAEEISAAVHIYFPRLLGVARAAPLFANRESLSIPWASFYVREKVCDFLGVEVNAEDADPPSGDSLVMEATRRVLSLSGWSPENGEFLLPWWADRGLLLGWQLGRLGPATFASEGTDFAEPPADYPFAPPSGDENESMSFDATLAWIKEREKGILRRLQSQMEDERLEVVIADGGNRRAPHPGDHRAPPSGEPIPGSPSAPEFWRDRRTDTWTIRITSLSPDPIPIADNRSVNLDYLWAALKAGRGGAWLSQIANEAGMRGRPDVDTVSGTVAQAAQAGLSPTTCGPPAIDTRVIHDAKTERDRLETEAQKAEQDGHPDKAIALRERADDIQHHIQTQTRPFRGARREKSDAARTANTVQQGIKRALKVITKGNQKVGDFLAASLEFGGGRCWTRCDTDEWRFYE